MPFGRFYIKNYRANYNSYFPLKVDLSEVKIQSSGVRVSKSVFSKV